MTDAEYYILEECLDGPVDYLGVLNAINKLLRERIELHIYKAIVDKMLVNGWVKTAEGYIKATKKGKIAYERGQFA